MKTLAVCAIAGLLVGAVLGVLFDSLATPWKRLADSPKPVISLRVLPGRTIVAETDDGTLYSCSRSTVKCWGEATPGQSLHYSGESEDCWLLTRVHFNVTHRGMEVQQCQAIDSPTAAAGRLSERIVLDRESRIWYQYWVTAPFSVVGRVVAITMLATMVGLAFGSLALLGRRNRHAGPA